jgi:hypothetical protein
MAVKDPVNEASVREVRGQAGGGARDMPAAAMDPG